MPFMNTYWIARTSHGNRGQYAALYTMAWSAAQTLGLMAGVQVAQVAGFSDIMVDYRVIIVSAYLCLLQDVPVFFFLMSSQQNKKTPASLD